MTWFEISITNDALNFQKNVSFFIGPLSLHNIKTVLFDLVLSQNHNKLEHNILLLCLESEIAYNHYWLRCSLLTVYVLHCSQISLRLIVVYCLIFFLYFLCKSLCSERERVVEKKITTVSIFPHEWALSFQSHSLNHETVKWNTKNSYFFLSFIVKNRLTERIWCGCLRFPIIQYWLMPWRNTLQILKNERSKYKLVCQAFRSEAMYALRFCICNSVYGIQYKLKGNNVLLFIYLKCFGMSVVWRS